MKDLTDWTAFLASSLLHLNGLSQQETFLLNEKNKIPKKYCWHMLCGWSLYYIYITTTQCIVLLAPTHHSIPPLFVFFCNSALQCSWVDFIISTAKSCWGQTRWQMFGLPKRQCIQPPQTLSALTVIERSSYFVSEFCVESKLVLRLPIRYLIFSEPVNSGL